jgi:predicted ArsR family transcriptional regulator
MDPSKTPQPSAITLIPDARRNLLTRLKDVRWATISELAGALLISPEAVRQQISVLEKEGWVVSNCGPDVSDDLRSRGRPAVEYCLSAAADDLFPKQYAELAVSLFDDLVDPIETLSELTDERVAVLQKSSAPLRDRIEDLRSIYVPNDPFTDIERTADGYRLIENNCPFLNFATERPLFCSTTVSALRRATGCEVVREERFQDGDRRCIFHIYFDAPVSEIRKTRRFEPEPEKSFRPQ